MPVRFVAFTWASVFALLAATLLPVWAQAAPPKVAASIKPVQALVKAVMGPLGTPELIVPATTSPHVFALKPSQAKALSNTDMIFWIGPGLETALAGPLDALSKEARVVQLLKTPGLDLIAYGDDEDKHGHDEHGHAGHHDHGEVDPHIWLSPKNALIIVDAIRDEMIAADPPNATEYTKNAKQARQRINILIRKTEDFTSVMRETPYLVQHDGFAYLARDFGLNEAGHIQTTPGREPGAKHVAMVLDQIREKDVKCLFHETQFSPKLARQLGKETGVGLREIDPIGADLSLSVTTYVRLVQSIIVQMESCLYRGKSGNVPKVPLEGLKRPET